MLTFAYLGAPRTTRQSRTWSLIFAIAAVVTLRALGFVGVLGGARVQAALLVPYAALLAALVFGYRGISRGLILEPPTLLIDAMTQFMKRVSGDRPA